MQIHPLHAWPTDARTAKALQRTLADQRRVEPLAPITADTLIAGCDLAYEKVLTSALVDPYPHFSEHPGRGDQRLHHREHEVGRAAFLM